MQVRNKVVVVTGAASGIGRAMCQRFAAEGAAAVVVADINGEGAQQLAQTLAGQTRVLAIRVDVSQGAGMAALVTQVEAELGHIDLFCANAGIFIAGDQTLADADWQRIWDINVMAHIHAARAVLPAMLARGEGYLLITASAAGLLSQVGSAPYAVTKHAAVGFAEWLSITYGSQGLRVSVLCPQAVRTQMTANTGGGGVAGVDGMLEPDALMDTVIETLAGERFLCLPHPQVLTYMQRKTADYDRWLDGMRRLNERFGDQYDKTSD